VTEAPWHRYLEVRGACPDTGTPLAEDQSQSLLLLLEGIALRLQADLLWLEACERNWTDRRRR
jgi:hypothetical protein